MNLTLKVKVKSKTRKRRRIRKSKLKKNSKKSAYHKALSVNNLGDIQSSDVLQKSFEMEKGQKAIRADKPQNNLVEDDFGFGECQSDDMEEEGAESKTKRTQIFLLKSIYKGRPKTCFFPYPTCCALVPSDETKSRVIDLVKHSLKGPKITFRYPGNGFHNCKHVSQEGGLKQCYEKDWNILWVRNQYTVP